MPGFIGWVLGIAFERASVEWSVMLCSTGVFQGRINVC